MRTHGGLRLDEEVPMPLWALVHSVRYAMGRNTYANCDAARLCKQYWDVLPEFIQEQFREDVRRIDWGGPMKAAEDRACWEFMFENAGRPDSGTRRSEDSA